MSTLKLTHLGALAALYGTQTTPEFWRSQLKDVMRVADQDGDWEQMLRERIDGLCKLRDNVYDHGLDWFAEVVE